MSVPPGSAVLSKLDLLGAIAAHTSDAVFAKDREGRYILANEGAARALGRPLADVLGRTDAELIPAEIAARLHAGDDAAIAAGVTISTEEIVRPAGGPPRTFHTIKGPLRDAEGAITGVFGIARDVTSERLPEREVRERAEAAESRYLALVNGLDHAIAWEAEAHALAWSFVSLRAEKVLGFPMDRWRADPRFFLQCVHPDDRAAVLEMLRAAVVERVDKRMDHRMVQADGGVLWVHTGVSVGEQPGVGTVLRGLTVDVSELKSTEVELHDARARDQEARARIAFLYEATRTLLAELPSYRDRVHRLLDLFVPKLAERCVALFGDGEITKVASVAAEGAVRAAAVPDDVLRRLVVDPQDPSLRAALEGIAHHVIPLRGRGRTYGALVLLSCRAARRHGTDDVALANELAAQASLALDNAHIIEEAERAARGREELVRIVSHDLRDALGAVQLAASLADRNAQTPGKEGAVRRHLSRIVRQVDSIHRLVASILDAARIESGRLTVERAPVVAADLAREIVELVDPLAEARGLTLALAVPADLPPLLADRERMVQVLANLLGNAIKFTKQGTVTLSARAGEGEVIFSVADTGPGIPDDQLPHLFDRYWQAGGDLARRGVGLGLFVVKSIVEAHGGRIWVDSRKGVGTTFYFAIPTSPGKDDEGGA